MLRCDAYTAAAMYAARCCDAQRSCAAPPTRRLRCALHVAAMRRSHGGADARCTLLRGAAHTAALMPAATLLRCADHTAALMHAARCCAALPTRRLRCTLHVAAMRRSYGGSDAHCTLLRRAATRRLRCTLPDAVMRRPHGGCDVRCTLLRCAAHTAAAMHAARCCDAPFGVAGARCTLLRCTAHTAAAMYAARCCGAPLTRRH